MSRFHNGAAGIEMNLDGSEIAVLSRLDGLLSSAGTERSDPAASRLAPQLYSDDAAASREFARLVAKERVEAKRTDRDRFTDLLELASSGPVLLDEEDAARFVRVLGEARIVIASRKGLFEAGLPEEMPSDPEVALVLLLGYLQEELVGVMLARMEEKA